MKTKLGSSEMAERAWRATQKYLEGIGAEEYPEDLEEDTLTDPESGEIFQWLGSGVSRIGLLGPDDVVYKVPVGGPYEYQVHEELEVFEVIDKAEFGWAPEYWPYEHGVVAMPRYIPYSDIYRSSRHFPYNWQPEHLSLVAEMRQVSRDAYPYNVGLRDDGSLVLFDGGSSYYERVKSLESMYA